MGIPLLKKSVSYALFTKPQSLDEFLDFVDSNQINCVDITISREPNKHNISVNARGKSVVIRSYNSVELFGKDILIYLYESSNVKLRVYLEALETAVMLKNKGYHVTIESRSPVGTINLHNAYSSVNDIELAKRVMKFDEIKDRYKITFLHDPQKRLDKLVSQF